MSHHAAGHFSTIIVKPTKHQHHFNLKYAIPAFLGFLLLASCTNTNHTTGSVVSNNTSVETLPPNTPSYKPAFAGQTRIQAVKTNTAYNAKVVTSALAKPWSIAPLPDGRFLITEKAGALRIVADNGTVSGKIAGVPNVDAAGQGGLLGITLDPAFATNRMIYFVFSERVGNGNHAAVAKARLSDDEQRIENVQVIYRAMPTYNGDKHYGGKLAFNRDGNLFVSTGERSDLATRPLAQDNTTALGKILLITTEGKAVTDPLALISPNALPEIYSTGHRNTLGIAIHPVTGVLWNAEMGPKGGDEINIIERGKNYGWPTITYGIEYSNKTIGEGITQKAGLEQPVYYWDPSISPGGIAFYTGSDMPEWSNNLFVGALSGKHIIRLVLDGNRVTGEERLLAGENQRFRDVAVGRDGKLYAITDEGRLYVIEKK